MTIAYEPASDRVAGGVALGTQRWVHGYSVPEERFGELVRRLRDRAGLSQDALAEAVGLSRKTIYAIENSRAAHPKFENEHEVVRKMATALRVAVSTLSVKLGWLPAEEADSDWRAGLHADDRYSEETKELIERIADAFLHTGQPVSVEKPVEKSPKRRAV